MKQEIVAVLGGLMIALVVAAGAAEPGPLQTVGVGAYPDLAVDRSGQVHFVYVRGGGVYYRVFRPAGRWSPEERVPIQAGDPSRSDPEVALDPRQRPHVLSGRSYAWKEGGRWRTIPIDVNRDTALALDAKGAAYVCRRGGHNGGLVGLVKRPAGGNAFIALPDPDIANGLPRGKGSDHVYGHVFAHPTDGSVHVVTRHGSPLPVIYRVSTDGGLNWTGSAVAADRSEAPSGAVAPGGDVFVVTGKGMVYQRAGAPPYTWVDLGTALTASPRDLPALAADSAGLLYAVCFGGKYNVRSHARWLGERRLPAPQGKPLGFTEIAAGGTNVYVVYEEGEHVNHEVGDHLTAGNATIHFTRLLPDGSLVRP